MLVPNPSLQGPLLFRFDYGKSRGEACLFGVLPQNLSAEGMDGVDEAFIRSLERVLKTTFVSLECGNGFSQAFLKPSTHLAGGLAGKGDCGHVFGRHSVPHQRYHTADKRRRLAGPGSGFDDDVLLFLELAKVWSIVFSNHRPDSRPGIFITDWSH
jgi:hypothetical protein